MAQNHTQFNLMLLVSAFLTAFVAVATSKTFDLTPNIQELKSIGDKIKFLGCSYEVDRLFLLNCPS